ncbi:MAG: cyanophycinase, partial [Candidatus Aminicenantes bacterium]|nr:cyanophycinase [Candidatus Aminicenantes bacterium]
DTAVVVGPDQTFEVIGESGVLVLDPGRASVRTLPSKLLNIEAMTLHLLTPGARYSLKDRVVIH